MSSQEYKSIATDFLMLASKGQSREAFCKYVCRNFKHHNIYFKGDAESLMNAMEDDAKKSPNKVFDIKRAIQDDNLVAVHSHVSKNSDDLGAAVIQIFRFEDGKITGLWDFGQPVSAVTINENGIF